MAKLKKSANKSNIVPLFTADDIGKLAKEYADVSAQIKQLEATKKSLSDRIKEGAEQFGTKDDKGSFYLESDKHIMGKVAKKSFQIRQDEAVNVLESMGLGDVCDVVTVKTVNEDRLQQAVKDGRIDMKTIREFTDEKVNYSVLVKEKEEVPEVEQTTLSAAKKKK